MKNRDKFNYFYSFILIPIFLLILSYYSMSILGGFSLQIISIKTFIFSFIIMILFHLFLSLEYRDSFKSIITISIILFLICFINQVKIIYMNEPLFISDFNFIQNYSNIGVFTGSSLLKYILLLFLKSIPIIIINIFLCFIGYKFRVIFTNKKSYIYGLIFFFVLFILLCPFKFSRRIYSKYIYSDRIYSVEKFVSYKDLYSYYGIISGIYYQYINSFIDYNRYSESDIKKIEKYDDMEYNNSTLLGKANVIVILNESFFDINKISQDIRFNDDILSEYNLIKEEGDFVNVISPSFGGETANVLYELLIGGNMSYFNSGFIPFIDLYRDNRERDSLVKVFKNNGYNTSLIAGEDSYDLDSTIKKIGFDEYFVIHNKNVKGLYTSDEAMAQLVIDKLNSSDDNNFIVVETMQNHMPYYLDKYDNYDVSVVDSNLNQEDTDIIKSYAQGVSDASNMLGIIKEYINSIDKDTIVIFFGDHLPSLKNSNLEDIYSKLKYFNTDSDLLNLFRKYNTEALIFSNFNNEVLYPEYLGYDLLLNYIVNNMDLDIPMYYKWLYSSSNSLSTYNRYLGINSKGNVCYINELDKESIDMLEIRNLMFYKNFIMK